MVKALVKKILGRERWGVRGAITQCLWELQAWGGHCRGRWRARRYRGQRDLKIQLGCGRNVKSGWVNIDLSKEADLTVDLRKRIPLDSDSCALVYAEHFLEHLDYPEPAMSLLREVRRILRPGGVVHIGVPDGARAIRAYVDAEFAKEHRKYRRITPIGV